MDLYRYFRDRICETVASADSLPEGLDVTGVTVEPPRDPAHGDIATNAAMALARPARMKPRDIAERLAPAIAAIDGVASVDIAGPGFINVRLTEGFWHARLTEILRVGRRYGDSDLGANHPINVEYVSANPTGPMHVGHARGAVFGDALANLLEKSGWDVTREYYINDAGAQVDVLARSLHYRYREVLGRETGPMPEGLYPGDYLVGPAEALAEREGEGWLDAPEAEWLAPIRDFVIQRMMDLIRDDLGALGIRHDVFTSERLLHEDGRVQHVVDELEAHNLVYTGVLEPPKGKPPPEDWEPRPQLLFRATEWGDDVDRPLKKSDGSWTYFAADIAYHLDKYRRGFADMIDVLGADHGGYVKRMVAATRAVTGDQGRLVCKLCQLVQLFDGGEPVKMSKRAGTFVTLRDVVDRVGKDVVRFMLLTRKNEAPLDFDFVKVQEQSRDNPVFYVQYAHARCCSVFRNAEREVARLDLSPEAIRAADLTPLIHPEELALIKLMATWPRTVEQAAEAWEPHRLAFFLYDLASAFHAFWTKGKDADELRFIQPANAELTLARLALVEGVRTVIRSGLQVLGVTPAEEMR